MGKRERMTNQQRAKLKGMTERQIDLVHSTTLGHLERWLRGADDAEDARVREAYKRTGCRFRPERFVERPWIDAATPPVRTLVALDVISLASVDARADVQPNGEPRVLPLLVKRRTDRQAAYMSLLSGETPTVSTRQSVADVIIHETRAMRMAIRRAWERVCLAWRTLMNEAALDVEGRPLFATTDASRLRRRPDDMEDAMFQAVALTKLPQFQEAALLAMEEHWPEAVAVARAGSSPAAGITSSIRTADDEGDME
jgi:hypothetical protein